MAQLTVESWLSGLAGISVGALVTWLWAHARSEARSREAQTELRLVAERLAQRTRERDDALARLAQADRELAARQEQLAALREHRARLETTLSAQRQLEQEKLAFVSQSSVQLRESFQALSADVLRGNGQTFLDLARETLGHIATGAQVDLAHRQEAIDAVVAPLKASLTEVDGRIRELEAVRAAGAASLGQQIASLGTAQASLQRETARLASALRAPNTRGRWGELQLRRVVELAGMVDRCDFEEQVVLPGDGGLLKPDLVVRLPGGRSMVIDAKVPLESYLDSLDAVGEDERQAKLAGHARALREHIRQLGSKAYWGRLPRSPEFAVLFLPGESFFSAALEQDPSLIEFGAEHGVMLSTPTTLIALLRAVAYGWREEQVATNAREIMLLGRELHDRVRLLAGHFVDLRRALGAAVGAYNRTVGTLENRILSSARKLRDLSGGGGESLPPVEPLEDEPRPSALPEPFAAGALAANDPRAG